MLASEFDLVANEEACPAPKELVQSRPDTSLDGALTRARRLTKEAT